MKSGNINFVKARNRILESSALILSVSIIWGVVCACKDIYPFGQFMMDFGDMSEQSIPLYIHLWDALHGEKALFFDWYTGLGNNMSGAIWHFGLISPYNLFFLFIRRSSIESSMWLYILIKLLGIAFSIRFLLARWFPSLPIGIRISFCLLYVFSAFNMQYYYFPQWLDVVFMFPLMMYFYFLLMREGKETGYIVSLTIVAMMNFQHTWLLALMLMLLTGTVLIFKREQYKKFLFCLFKATMVSVALSAWVWVPGIIQIMGSARLSGGQSLSEIWNSVWIFYPDKWMKLINMGIPLSFFVLSLRRKHQRKGIFFFVVITAFLGTPIILESTNLLWHGGSYQSYTMRFSYMLAFWIIVGGGYCYDVISINGKPHLERSKALNFAEKIFVCGLLYASAVIQFYFLERGISIWEIILTVVIVIFVNSLLFALWPHGYDKLIVLFIILQSMTLAYNAVHTTWLNGEGFIATGNTVRENEASESEAPLSRIKSMSIFLSHNYPLVMQKCAASNYMAAEGAEQIAGLLRLGYAEVGLRMSDYGGTVFSDALLGVKEIISREEGSRELYTYKSTYEPYKISDCDYVYNTGILIKEKWKDIVLKDGNPFVLQNQIAQTVLGKDIFETVSVQKQNFEVRINEKSILYLYVSNGNEVVSVILTDLEKGEEHSILLHESGWQNGILNLGVFEGKDLRIQINTKVGTKADAIDFGILGLSSFKQASPTYAESFQYEASSYAMELKVGNAKEGEYLFLPVYADRGWNCRVNGKRTDIGSFAGGCMVIPLEKGENRIEMTFWPVGFWGGMAGTLAGTGLFLRETLGRKKRIFERGNKVLSTILLGIWSVLVVVFYIIPVIFLIRFLV